MGAERVRVPPGRRSLQVLRWQSDPLRRQLKSGERQVPEPREETAFKHYFGRAEDVFGLYGFVVNVQKILDGKRRLFGGLTSLLRVRVCHHRVYWPIRITIKTFPSKTNVLNWLPCFIRFVRERERERERVEAASSSRKCSFPWQSPSGSQWILTRPPELRHARLLLLGRYISKWALRWRSYRLWRGKKTEGRAGVLPPDAAAPLIIQLDSRATCFLRFSIF